MKPLKHLNDKLLKINDKIRSTEREIRNINNMTFSNKDERARLLKDRANLESKLKRLQEDHAYLSYDISYMKFVYRKK